MSAAAKRQFSFADWEMFHQNVKLDPILQTISDLLDDNAAIIDAIRRDLDQGLKNPDAGRDGLTPQQVLRSLVLRRVKNWDYRELRERIADGFTLRKFTDFYSQPVPQHDAFNRSFNRVTPETLRAVNDLVVKAAVDEGLEDGSKLRSDTRAARRRMQEIQRMTSTARKSQQTEKYRALIGIAEEVMSSARGVLKQTKNVRGKTVAAGLAIEACRAEIEHYCGLGDRVIDQSRRRVLEGEQVPNAEKIYSIFEPHTDLIKRGKVRTPLEFGHKVFLAESANGLITQYKVLDGNPNDHHHVEPSLERHKEAFGQAPEVYSADRGFFSEENVEECTQDGVKVVCIPQCGGRRTAEREAYEKSPVFKKGQRFRAGVEGRISVLFRGRGMKRCLAEGRERFELWVGAAVLANNLMKIAELKNKRTRRKRKPADTSQKSPKTRTKRSTRRLK